MIRCPSCDATNPDIAAWCSQCYRRFDQAPTARSADPPGGAAPGFRRVGDTVEWTCPACAEVMTIDEDACRRCGTTMTASFAAAEPVPQADWATARRLGMLLPGAGHYAVGAQGSGLARAVLFGIWLLGGSALLATGSGAAFGAAPLLLGAAVVYTASLSDLAARHRGGHEVLAGRGLLWLVVAVTGGLLLTVLARAGS